MIWENKFDGYLRADPHDHIREFFAICDMFKYGETQSETVKLLMFPLSLSDKAKTLFNELNEESITSWDQMKRAFINRFFPLSLLERLLLEIKNFSQNVGESLTDAWLRIKNMLRKCHGQVRFKLDWSTKSKNKHHQKSVAFADGSNSNNDNSRIMKKLEALTIKMDSHFQSIKEELQDMRDKYYDLRDNHDSKNHMNDDTPIYERHEANYIQSRGHQNQNSNDSYSHPSHHDRPNSNNDSGKSLTKLINDVKYDLEDFKSYMRSKRTDHDNLFDENFGKTTSVLPNKKSKTVNQEPQSKTDLEKSITKFLDGQRLAGMYIKNNVNDMILKMK
ncbi:reverse transcriptase domain-containing protein [Tanacetum coccineum]